MFLPTGLQRPPRHLHRRQRSDKAGIRELLDRMKQAANCHPMSRKALLCAYCGRQAKHRRELTREHFVPRGLWAGRRPERTITVPVHKRCNGRFSEDDEYLRTVLVCLASGSSHPDPAQILRGPMARSFAKKPATIIKHLQGLAVRPISTPSGLYVGHAPTFVLNEHRLAMSLSRVVRGLYFSAYGMPVPPGYGIVVPIPAPSLADMAEMTADMSEARGFGDDVFLWRSVRDFQDQNLTCWLLVFYKAVYFFGWTLPPGHDVQSWSQFIAWLPEERVSTTAPP